MKVGDRDLGPMIPIVWANTKTGITGRTRQGYRASKHFTIWQYPSGSWALSNGHGAMSQFYSTIENVLEMVDYIEEQNVDWSAVTRRTTVPSLISIRLAHMHAELSTR